MYQNAIFVIQLVNEGLSRWPSGRRRRLEGPFLFGGRAGRTSDLILIWKDMASPSHVEGKKTLIFFLLFVTLFALLRSPWPYRRFLMCIFSSYFVQKKVPSSRNWYNIGFSTTIEFIFSWIGKGSQKCEVASHFLTQNAPIWVCIFWPFCIHTPVHPVIIYLSIHFNT